MTFDKAAGRRYATDMLFCKIEADKGPWDNEVLMVNYFFIVKLLLKVAIFS